jgi:hypothetical protein
MIDLEAATDYWDDLLIADGLDDAIVGIQEDTGIVFYSREKVMKILMERDGMSELDALEFADYNIFNAYRGEKTPVFLHDFFIHEK